MRITATIILTWMISTLFLGETVEAQRLSDFKIDKSHSSIVFKIKNRNMTFLYGRFNDVSGTIAVDDRRNPKKIEINATVNPRSLDTNAKKRDRTLKGKDFFNTFKYKEIKFVTKETKQLEEKGKFELVGELTLLGKTLPLTVIFEHTGSKKMPNNSYRVGGQTSFTLKRSDFGMTEMIPEVADEVEIFISLEAEIQRTPSG